MDNILKYGPEIYETAKAKGFWEDGWNRNKGEMVMLIITELSEAVEAHRKDRKSLTSSFENAMLAYKDWDKDSEGYKKQWLHNFQLWVKDSVEDEIADAVIRILDYCYGWNYHIAGSCDISGTGNFAEDVLRICDHILSAYKTGRHSINTGQDKQYFWGCVLDHILKFCSWYNINLEQHVVWKLRYNQSRPHKHGKAY